LTIEVRGDLVRLTGVRLYRICYCLHDDCLQLTVTGSYGDNQLKGSVTMLDEVLLRTWIILVALIIICIKEANAFDGGDAAALIIGLVVGVLGICSCLGYYARRRGA